MSKNQTISYEDKLRLFQEWYPHWEREQTIAEARAIWPNEIPIKTAGRIKAIRLHGKTAFMDIFDFSGQIQVYLRKDRLPDYDLYKKGLDIGDIIGVEGEAFLTKTGELTLSVSNLCLLAKCLHPLPIGKEKR